MLGLREVLILLILIDSDHFDVVGASYRAEGCGRLSHAEVCTSYRGMKSSEGENTTISSPEG